jgi:hypothetical protein
MAGEGADDPSFARCRYLTFQLERIMPATIKNPQTYMNLTKGTRERSSRTLLDRAQREKHN